MVFLSEDDAELKAEVTVTGEKSSNNDTGVYYVQEAPYIRYS